MPVQDSPSGRKENQQQQQQQCLEAPGASGKALADLHEAAGSEEVVIVE